MFTGIIESISQLIDIKKHKSNHSLTFKNNLVQELTVKQSLCHNGICLTIEDINLKNNTYHVTAIQETVQRTNLIYSQKDDLFNIERCLAADGRFDGHIVQGHVDCVGRCILKEDEGGSFKFTFEIDERGLIVEKGSITIDGVSLTVVKTQDNTFSVAIIPYTYQHTNFKRLKVGDYVNLEFDIVGKYIQKIVSGIRLK